MRPGCFYSDLPTIKRVFSVMSSLLLFLCFRFTAAVTPMPGPPEVNVDALFPIRKWLAPFFEDIYH